MRFTKEGDNFKEKLRDHVEKVSDVHLSSCYQCGKCSAGCPMAENMDFTTNQIMRLLNLGQFEQVINCKAIWNCISCETCTTRCPRELDPAAVMDALRMMAKARGSKGARNNMEKFNRIFLEIVRLRGRLYEPGLIGFYNLLSGDFFKDFDLALPMVIQGKLKPWQIPGIGDIEALQRMVDKCNQFAEEEERAHK